MLNSAVFRLLRYTLYAVLAMPLLVWSIFLFPFITTKILYFRLLVELAAVLYIPLAIKYPEIRPKWNALTGAVWLYMAVLFLTSLLGVNFNHSFWSTVERGEGIVSMLHFAAYFTILSAVFRTREDWSRYLHAAVGITAAVALYGVAQLLDLPIVIHAGAARISGTIGNAAFFAAFVMFGIFLSLYLLYDNPKRRYLWLVVILELFVLYHSQTRGAIVAFVGAAVLYSIFLLFKSPSRKIKLTAGGTLVLIVLATLVLYAGRHSNFVQRHDTLLRLATISVTDITTQSRFDTWRASWKGWQDRFLTGYGYENYYIAFNKYFPARIFKDQGSQIWFDRAHNIIFDVAVASGIVGLLAYFGIFMAALRSLWKTLRSPNVSWQMPAILGALLAAYFLQNIFVFDTQATYLMFFLTLGLISFLKNEYASPSGQAAVRRPGYEPGFVTVAILSVIMFAAAYFVNIEPAAANIKATVGIKYAKSQMYREVLPAFKDALSLGTYMDEEIRLRAVDYAQEAVNSGQLSREEQDEAYKYMIAELEKSLNESPLDAKNYLYLMNVLNRLGSSEVFRFGEKALERSPTRPQIYFELGQAAFNQKDFEKGLEFFRQAIALNPQPKESHLNYLLAAVITGRQDIADDERRIITELGYNFESAEYQALARAYLQAGNKQKMLENYLEAAKLAPGNPDLQARIAAAYGEVCDVENATATVAAAVKLDPSFQAEAEVFLKQLEEKCGK